MGENSVWIKLWHSGKEIVDGNYLSLSRFAFSYFIWLGFQLAIWNSSFYENTTGYLFEFLVPFLLLFNFKNYFRFWYIWLLCFSNASAIQLAGLLSSHIYDFSNNESPADPTHTLVDSETSTVTPSGLMSYFCGEPDALAYGKVHS